jgi:lipopolysaccharide/colanic/teichoic acid biosynthesis glycosyltransferase
MTISNSSAQWADRVTPVLAGVGDQAEARLRSGAIAEAPADGAREGALFWRVKRAIDIVLCLLAAPAVILVAGFVLLGNLVGNRGPLFFWQERMGRGCRPFRMVKFRTMRPADRIERGPDDPVETDRITPFGAFLRDAKLDELPQIWNVLKGDMSLIGPRPDYLPHAQSYMGDVPGYRTRHEVTPGITGLAQITTGYAEGVEATAAKVRMDLAYMRHAGFMLDLLIFTRTLGFGLGAAMIERLRRDARV